MKFVSENAEYEIMSVISAIRKDSGSWEDWRALRVEMPLKASLPQHAATHANVRRLLESHLREKEGGVFLSGLDEIAVFCKEVSEETLKSIGHQILDIVVQEAGVAANFSLFDVARDAEHLVSIYSYGAHAKKRDLGNVVYFELQEGQPPRYGKSAMPCSSKVLLVEDDPVTRWMVRKALKDDFALATAQDVTGAVSAYQNYRPDVVLLDLNLPGGNGREVMSDIMRSDPGAHVVVFSSHNNMDNIVDMLEAGASGFISKPFRKEKLLQYIRERIPRK